MSALLLTADIRADLPSRLLCANRDQKQRLTIGMPALRHPYGLEYISVLERLMALMALLHWIAHKVCLVAGTSLALAVLAAPVRACPGGEFHLTILLDAIPQAAEDSEVLAKVEIVDVQVRRPPGVQYPFTVAQTRVLKSIRGVAYRQMVEIEASNTSCGGGLGRDDIGRQGFIAGRFIQFANQTLFAGMWSVAQISDFSSGLRSPEMRPWWGMPRSAHYSPWHVRAALIILVLFLLWQVAGWLDRRTGAKRNS
jgi:hypothetical protein